MPLHEAVARAGTFEALRPALLAGRVRGRAKAFYNGPNGGVVKHPDRNIDPSWWAVAHVDPAAGRAQFTMALGDSGVTYELLAIGIEFERAAVEALWPSKPKAPGRKRGRKPDLVWKQIFSHFDPVVRRKGKFHSLGSAASSVEAWLEEDEKRVQLDNSTLKRGIRKNRPDWFEA